MIRAAGAQPGGEWRFSVLDRACLNMVIKGMWLFHGRLDAAAMKESFARLLGYYPHLCGRVMRGEAVACDNSGVPFAVDEAPRCRLEQAVLMPDAPGALEHFSHIVAQQNANIILFQHDRVQTDLEIGEAIIHVVCEVGGVDHAKRLIDTLTDDGYKVFTSQI